MKLYLEEKSLSQSISGVRWKGRRIKNKKSLWINNLNRKLHVQFKLGAGILLYTVKIILKKIYKYKRYPQPCRKLYQKSVEKLSTTCPHFVHKFY